MHATDHRPWPLPRARWVLAMRWHDLLFAHWSLPPKVLAATLPAGLELDTRSGRGWLGVVPFRMSGVRLRGLPPLPGSGAFPELNLRTYVVADGKPGVWFYSLEAASRLAVWTARHWFHLPYVHARMSARAEPAAEAGGEPGVRYASRRSSDGGAELACRYAPAGPVFHASPGSLEHWLTERYCLYAAAADGRLLRGEIHHLPWPLQPARASFEANQLAPANGLELPDEAPHLLFARRLDVVAFAPRPVAC